MGKAEYLANGGVEGAIYDNRWKIALPAIFLLGAATDHFVPRLIQNYQETGARRNAICFAQALGAQGLIISPAGYAQQPRMQAGQVGIASALPVVQGVQSTDEKTYKILENVERMLRDYGQKLEDCGERIARLEGKTETKPSGGS